ncbi:MAG: FAD-dependent oxidoreductase, partial [Candidatus Eisenbacteria sp.]|nr:FAD-dependent oxidoreductase [Candidatus Eisenbacteria bacterium]
VLTTGGFDSRKILGPGNGREQLLPQVHLMIDFLDALKNDRAPQPGSRVMIVGGASRALELARACRKLGAQKVTLITSGPEAGLPEGLRDQQALAQAGLEVLASTVVSRIFGAGDSLTDVVLEQLPPDNGRPAATTVASVDTLIVAAGRIPELVIAPVKTGGAEEDEDEVGVEAIEGLSGQPTWGTVDVHRTLPAMCQAGVFSSPESGRTGDASAVVRAILSGRRVARATHQHLTGRPITPIAHLATEAGEILNASEISGVPVIAREGSQMPLREPSTGADWTSDKELSGLSEQEARREADRCLQCGLICYRKAM